MVVNFSSEDMDKIRALAIARNAIKEQAGTPTKKLSCDKSDEQIHFEGIRAELAVARCLGLQIDETHTTGKGPRVDLTYKGLTIEVRYSRYPRINFVRPDQIAWLKIDKLNGLADVIILVTAPPVYIKGDNVVDVAGWITKREFERECVMVNWGYGAKYSMSVQNMHGEPTPFHLCLSLDAVCVASHV